MKENMGKLVTIVVCPLCENEMIRIEDSRLQIQSKKTKTERFEMVTNIEYKFWND